MAYTVEFAPAADRQLKALPKPIQTQIIRRIEKLETNPRPPGCEKLKGADDLYRIRFGDYRIIYTINDKDLLVLVVKIADRIDVYRRLAK
ncbi:MAG: type II toxin-antitoxin system RelE/ParE family toxin [Nitrospirae bacterium]|nr:MAG: type II toxin-antitoxin system RelE/ParE family toxin [Nitrospirota bacterium]